MKIWVDLMMPQIKQKLESPESISGEQELMFMQANINAIRQKVRSFILETGGQVVLELPYRFVFSADEAQADALESFIEGYRTSLQTDIAAGIGITAKDAARAMNLSIQTKQIEFFDPNSDTEGNPQANKVPGDIPPNQVANKIRKDPEFLAVKDDEVAEKDKNAPLVPLSADEEMAVQEDRVTKLAMMQMSAVNPPEPQQQAPQQMAPGQDPNQPPEPEQKAEIEETEMDPAKAEADAAEAQHAEHMSASHGKIAGLLSTIKMYIPEIMGMAEKNPEAFNAAMKLVSGALKLGKSMSESRDLDSLQKAIVRVPVGTIKDGKMKQQDPVTHRIHWRGVKTNLLMGPDGNPISVKSNNKESQENELGKEELDKASSAPAAPPAQSPGVARQTVLISGQKPKKPKKDKYTSYQLVTRTAPLTGGAPTAPAGTSSSTGAAMGKDEQFPEQDSNKTPVSPVQPIDTNNPQVRRALKEQSARQEPMQTVDRAARLASNYRSAASKLRTFNQEFAKLVRSGKVKPEHVNEYSSKISKLHDHLEHLKSAKEEYKQDVAQGIQKPNALPLPKSALEKQTLEKAPEPFLSEMNNETGEYEVNPDISMAPETPGKDYKKIHSRKLKNGLIHTVHEDSSGSGRTHLHQLRHPGVKAPLASMRTFSEDFGGEYGSPEVQHSAVNHRFKGKGLGRQLYQAALEHHGVLNSDSLLTAHAQKAWEHLADQRGVASHLEDYKEGSPGRHSVEATSDYSPEYPKVKVPASKSLSPKTKLKSRSKKRKVA